MEVFVVTINFSDCDCNSLRDYVIAGVYDSKAKALKTGKEYEENTCEGCESKDECNFGHYNITPMEVE